MICGLTVSSPPSLSFCWLASWGWRFAWGILVVLPVASLSVCLIPQSLSLGSLSSLPSVSPFSSPLPLSLPSSPLLSLPSSLSWIHGRPFRVVSGCKEDKSQCAGAYQASAVSPSLPVPIGQGSHIDKPGVSVGGDFTGLAWQEASALGPQCI